MSHQKLEKDAQLNILVGNLAKEHWTRTKKNAPKNIELQKEGWVLYVQEKKMAQMNVNEVYHNLMLERVMLKWEEYTGAGLEGIKNINWKICG